MSTNHHDHDPRPTTNKHGQRRRVPVVGWDEGEESPTSPLHPHSRRGTRRSSSNHHKSSSHHHHHHKSSSQRKADSRVIRGAEIIRRQIQQQMEAKNSPKAVAITPTTAYEPLNNSSSLNDSTENATNFLSLLEEPWLQNVGKGLNDDRHSASYHKPHKKKSSSSSSSSHKRKALVVHHDEDGVLRHISADQWEDESPNTTPTHSHSVTYSEERATYSSFASDGRPLQPSLRPQPIDTSPDPYTSHRPSPRHLTLSPPVKGDDELGSQWTYMGRDRKIKTKATTYIVEPMNSHSHETFTDTELEDLFHSDPLEYADDDDDDDYDDIADTDYDEVDVDRFADYKSLYSQHTSSFPARKRLADQVVHTAVSDDPSLSSIEQIEEDIENQTEMHLFVDETNQMDFSENDLRRGPPSQVTKPKNHFNFSENDLRQGPPSQGTKPKNQINYSESDLRKGPASHGAQHKDCQPHLSKSRDLVAFNRVATETSVTTTTTTTATISSTTTSSHPLPPTVPSPLSPQYKALMKDVAFKHAQSAGHLWQSLVGQHARFPKEWFNGGRAPLLGCGFMGDEEQPPRWKYCGRQQVKFSSNLNKLVRHRGSPGRLLLHVIVQDLMTNTPVQDVAVGCFHPSARGIRSTDQADPSLDDCRDVWWAVRKRSPSVSVVDPLLQPESSTTMNCNASFSSLSSCEEEERRRCKTPLGLGAPRVTNYNMKAIFGEQPPLETIYVVESDVYELLATAKETLGKSPALALLDEFVL